MQKQPEALLAHEPVSGQAGFAEIYASGSPPWETGKPKPPFRAGGESLLALPKVPVPYPESQR
ncbi:MAG: hypothetical protein ABSF35_09305 [Polyangia bacterium]|jgi:hypothetical protein